MKQLISLKLQPHHKQRDAQDVRREGTESFRNSLLETKKPSCYFDSLDARKKKEKDTNLCTRKRVSVVVKRQ